MIETTQVTETTKITEITKVTETADDQIDQTVASSQHPMQQECDDPNDPAATVKVPLSMTLTGKQAP